MTLLSCPSCGANLPEPSGGQGTQTCSYCGRRVALEQGAPVAPLSPVAPPAADAGRGTRARTFLVFALATLIVLTIGMLALLAYAAQQAAGGEAQSPAAHRIEYRVSGSVRNATLTYTNASGGTEQREVRLPWTRTLTVEDVYYVYIAAMSIEETGTLTCEIKLDGAAWKDATSRGTNVMVTCGGTPDGP